MVQFKRPLTPSECEYGISRSNTYWMLGTTLRQTAHGMRQTLEEGGYKSRKNASKAVLASSLGRLERGLLCYEKCNVDQLPSFCESRGLMSKAMTVLGLARRLEKADDDSTFPRFLELPPEIRNLIYECHFAAYEAINHKHYQPPITLASRQMRGESLPLFYKCATFEWHFTAYNRHGRDPRFTPASRGLTMMPAAKLCQIKRFKVVWNLRYGFQRFTLLEIEFYEQNGMKVTPIVPNPHDDAKVAVLEKIVDCTTQDIGCFNKNWKLQYDHFDVFQRSVNKVLDS